MESIDSDEPISGVRQVPLDVIAKQSNADVKTALARVRSATHDAITSQCELARQARASSPSSSQRMKAVRPGEPPVDGDITQRFEAIRANVR